MHVPEQRAKCLDCHSEIHHRLVRGEFSAVPSQGLSKEAAEKKDRETKEKALQAMTQTLRRTVMANCARCHPDHHTDQIKLLTGVGGKGVSQGKPNEMLEGQDHLPWLSYRSRDHQPRRGPARR